LLSWSARVSLKDFRFGNQNTVCKPTTPKWRTTVERLKERWNIAK